LKIRQYFLSKLYADVFRFWRNRELSSVHRSRTNGTRNELIQAQLKKETIMKKFIIVAIALGALAGAASAAQNRSYDLRDLEVLNAYTSDGIYLPISKSGDNMLPLIKKPASTVIDHSGEHQNSTN
jgi:hypothetical protein